MKKLFSILVCFCLIIPYFSLFSAFAVASEVPLLYDQLSANQKAVYNAMSANPYTVNAVVNLPDVIGYDNAYHGLPDEAYNDASAIVAKALYAFAYDHPQYYWYNGYGYGVVQGTETQNPDGKYHVPMTAVRIIPKYQSGAFTSAADIEEKTNQMMNVVNSITISGNDRYEKVKAIHDKVISLTTYDLNLNTSSASPTNHYAVSVFLEPHLSVCEAYAAAFKILCDKENIPCVMIMGELNGGGHAWDYVKMDDGKWYAVDCTTDDNSTEYIFYDDFLASSTTTNVHFGNDATTFSDRHTTTNTYNYTYPELCTVPYAKIQLAPNSKAKFDKAHGFLIIPANATVENSAENPGQYVMDAPSNSTGETITVMSLVDFTDTTYKVVMLGDIVSDGAVNATDIEYSLNSSVGKNKVSADTPQFSASDINADGVIDGFDTAQLDLILN